MGEVKYKALLIGNNVFEVDPHQLPELKGPPNDIRGMEDALKHPQVGLHHPDDITTLLNATHSEIIEKVEDFFLSATPDDQLLFYYSGHGYLDLYGNLYLCARNSNTDRLTGTAVPDYMINSIIQNSSSKRVIVILDCCNSGKFKGSMDIPKHLLGEGRFVITSSRAKELSVDADEKDGYSAFTKHLILALLSNEIDTNKDGYISLNEVYDYIIPRLEKETKQKPKRNFSGSGGEVAIGRSSEAAPGSKLIAPGSVEPGAQKPILAISSSEIEIKDVSPDEVLPEEIIDVYNQGGGILNWLVECSDEWIKIEKANTYFKINFEPKPGKNRGRIYVRDQNGGGTKRIQVLVQMNEQIEKPRLELSEYRIDFGQLVVNSDVPKKMIRLINTGDGQLNANISCTNPDFQVQSSGDFVEVLPNVSREAVLEGQLIIRSAGGNENIPLSAVVVQGPILGVQPAQIDFGTVTEGENLTKTIHVSNEGSSDLIWHFEQQGAFFYTDKKNNRLELTLDARPGSYHGSVVIKSNGGDKTIDIKGTVEPKPIKKTAPPPVDLNGYWNLMNQGYLLISNFGSGYTYQEFNLMGVAVGQGNVMLDNNRVFFNGSNIFSGPVSGEFIYSGNQMSGYFFVLGQQMNMILSRQ
ncbi:caspase, EACC1-associated type [Maribellus sediminis]|uniref:caspase, EACC1-associated type n=1 Tax=Maribellus sediminis TaxID=2696285 RepID=UPI0014305B14|nr:caspase family protein [Maribellus sediminis]